MVSFQFRFADGKDKALIALGLFFAIIQGAALPLMIIVFGEMSDLFIYDALFENWLNEWLDTYCPTNVSHLINSTCDEFRDYVLEEPTTIM